MGFRQADNEGRGGFARIWSIEDKGNYSVAKNIVAFINRLYSD